MTDLKALRDRVAAGEWPQSLGALRSPPSSFAALADAIWPHPAQLLNQNTRLAWRAYLGSLDAALRLQEALLPE